MLHLGMVTLLPPMLVSLQYGIVGRAIAKKLVKVDCWDVHAHGIGIENRVDDRPYGGGPGMVLSYKPLQATITQAKTAMPAHCKTIYLSPQGKLIKQADLNYIALHKQPVLFVAGRYEGIDERIISSVIDEEWSLGDFVLSGGELAAMVFIDAIIRLIPGAIKTQATAQDSFMHGLLDYPHYTKPVYIDGMAVPPVLLTGNHQKIAEWRRKQMLGKTWLKRPDLFSRFTLSEIDQQLFNEFKQENNFL